VAFWSFGGASNRVRSKKLREEGCRVVLSVEVPADKLQAPLEEAFRKIQESAAIPGFRPGKASMDVVKQRFAEEAQSLMMDRVVREAVAAVLEEQDLRPLSIPIVQGIERVEGKPFKFQLSFEVPPKVDARDYKKIPVTRKSRPVTEEMVAQSLEDLRQRHARLVGVLTDVVEKDHFVLVDYEGWAGGKPLEGAQGKDEWVEMAAPQTIAGLAEGILGAKRGETREIAVKLQGGETANFRVTIKDLKKKIVPDLDEELAKDLGFSSLLEVRAKLREALEKTETSKADKELERQIQEHLLKANPVPVPETLVQAEVKHLMAGVLSSLGVSDLGPKEMEELKVRLRPEAENSVRLGYILKSIADKEKLAVTDADFAQEQERSLDAAATEDEKDRVRKFFAEHRRAILDYILEGKVWKFLKESAKITEG